MYAGELRAAIDAVVPAGITHVGFAASASTTAHAREWLKASSTRKRLATPARSRNAKARHYQGCTKPRWFWAISQPSAPAEARAFAVSGGNSRFTIARKGRPAP